MKLMTKLGAILAMATAMTLGFMNTATAAPVGGNEITGGLGFVQSAFDFSVQYDRGMGVSDIGGYFFLQTSKEKNSAVVVNQVISFGPQMKVHANAGRADMYIAPGVGISMIKDVNDAGKKTDVTTFGPTMRIGVLYPLTSSIKLGLERIELVNWFDDKAAGGYAYYQAAMGFSF